MMMGVTKALCEKDFYFFCQWVFKEIYHVEFDDNWHFKVLCLFMEKIYYGEIKRGLINIPPRYGKSQFIVILFSAWCYAKSPICNFIHVAYSDSLAMKNSNATKLIMGSDPYREFWNRTLEKSEQAKKRWALLNGGQFYAASSGGAVTGEGAGLKNHGGEGGCLLVDDPHKAETERSDVRRDNVISNFENALATRLNDPVRTPAVVIMQRLHEFDLAGFLLSGKSILGKFDHLYLPALCEKKKHSMDIRREDQALWSSSHNVKKLRDMEKRNPMLFAGQYQQRPAPLEGNIIKKEWLKFYKKLPEKSGRKIISCDMTFKESGSSWVVYSVYMESEAKVYLIDQVRGKWDFVLSVNRLLAMITKHKDYNAVVIEDKANGPAMIATIRQRVRAVIPYNPKSSKVERLVATLPRYQAGDILYPDESIAPWINAHIHEMVVFPNGANDDRVDAETMALNYLGRKYIFRDI